MLTGGWSVWVVGSYIHVRFKAYTPHFSSCLLFCGPHTMLSRDNVGLVKSHNSNAFACVHLECMWEQLKARFQWSIACHIMLLHWTLRYKRVSNVKNMVYVISLDDVKMYAHSFGGHDLIFGHWCFVLVLPVCWWSLQIKRLRWFRKQKEHQIGTVARRINSKQVLTSLINLFLYYMLHIIGNDHPYVCYCPCNACT